jgi:hypothetical protein
VPLDPPVGANRASIHHSHPQIADATGLSKSQ